METGWNRQTAWQAETERHTERQTDRKVKQYEVLYLKGWESRHTTTDAQQTTTTEAPKVVAVVQATIFGPRMAWFKQGSNGWAHSICHVLHCWFGRFLWLHHRFSRLLQWKDNSTEISLWKSLDSPSQKVIFTLAHHWSTYRTHGNITNQSYIKLFSNWLSIDQIRKISTSPAHGDHFKADEHTSDNRKSRIRFSTKKKSFSI